MARKATRIGPNILALVEGARIDLARAALAVREGENEPNFGLPDDIPDPTDDEAVATFRQRLIQALSEFDHDELRPAEQRAGRIRALADGKGVTSLTTIVGRRLDDEQSQEFDRQPDQLCRSIWTYLRPRLESHGAGSLFRLG